MKSGTNSLNSISPIDGRYEKYTKDLAQYFSESASMKYKILIECEYLITLLETPKVGIRKLSTKEKSLIRNVFEGTKFSGEKIVTLSS